MFCQKNTKEDIADIDVIITKEEDDKLKKR